MVDSKPKRFMVNSTAQIIDIFDAVLELNHLDRSDVVMNLVREWTLELTEPELHPHINSVFDHKNSATYC